MVGVDVFLVSVYALTESSHRRGYTVVKVRGELGVRCSPSSPATFAAHPPDFVRFRANGSHQAVAADVALLRSATRLNRSVSRRRKTGGMRERSRERRVRLVAGRAARNGEGLESLVTSRRITNTSVTSEVVTLLIRNALKEVCQ